MGAMSSEANMHTFDTPGPINLQVELWVGRVDIHAEETAQTTVDLQPMHGDSTAQEIIDRARVEQHGDEIVVLMPKVKSGFFGRKGEIIATIRVPLDSSVNVETSSADLVTHGRLGDAKAQSGSGDVRLDHIADGQLRTGSGDLTIDTATGSIDSKCGSGDVEFSNVGADADIIAGSGDVTVGSIGGNLKVKTGSGDIIVRDAGDSVDAMAGSGDLLVKRIERGRLKAKTGSGDISVSVAEGTAAYLDVMTVTGDVSSSLSASEAPGDGDKTVELIIQAGTGDVVLQRA
jgi:DUF4097 and DUF4098 domain-containing protein YvlB